jgi:hypothetical protein
MVIQIEILGNKLVTLADNGEVRIYTNAQQLDRTNSVIVEGDTT